MVHVLAEAVGMFSGCLMAHILIWRIATIRNHGLAMAMLFLAVPGVVLGGGCVLSSWVQNLFQSVNWSAWGLAYLMHASLSIAYMFLYTGVSGFSPSIAILEKVAESMPMGLERSQLAPDWFTDETVSGRRHDNLIAAGLIGNSDGLLRLKARGRIIAYGFFVVRRLLGLPDIAKG